MQRLILGRGRVGGGGRFRRRRRRCTSSAVAAGSSCSCGRASSCGSSRRSFDGRHAAFGCSKLHDFRLLRWHASHLIVLLSITHFFRGFFCLCFFPTNFYSFFFVSAANRTLLGSSHFPLRRFQCVAVMRRLNGDDFRSFRCSAKVVVC